MSLDIENNFALWGIQFRALLAVELSYVPTLKLVLVIVFLAIVCST